MFIEPSAVFDLVFGWGGGGGRGGERRKGGGGKGDGADRTKIPVFMGAGAVSSDGPKKSFYPKIFVLSQLNAKG